jgi:hypothetical protein
LSGGSIDKCRFSDRHQKACRKLHCHGFGGKSEGDKQYTIGLAAEFQQAANDGSDVDKTLSKLSLGIMGFTSSSSGVKEFGLLNIGNSQTL